MAASLYGVMGWPVGHSASPAMMNAAFAEMGVNAHYAAFPVRPDAVERAIAGITALGIAGVNVTIPHKQVVMAQMQTLTEAARLAGAVNTVRVDAETGQLAGHNTDIEGWWTSIADSIHGSTRRLALLGAGGAARAVVTAMALYAPHVQVDIVARRMDQLDELRTAFAERIDLRPVGWEARHECIAEADVVVNTTPIGMWPQTGACPLADPSCLRAGQVVQDIVYRPLQTELLRHAEAAGAVALDGLWMLVYQGAAAITFWMERKAPANTMRQAALRFLGL